MYVPEQTGHLAQAASELPASDLGAAFFKMCVSLLILIILLVLSYWFLKRMIQNRMQKSGENASIHILEKRMLSPKTILYLVEVDKKKIVIAESQLEIKKLTEESLRDCR